jgi:hypothetical protein
LRRGYVVGDAGVGIVVDIVVAVAAVDSVAIDQRCD